MVVENTDSVYDRTAPPLPCRVLVVEDDDGQREMIAYWLALEGFDAATAANGRQALEYLHRSAEPRVILLDLMMPIMDGWEFRRQQQADPALARVPVIVVSGVDETRASTMSRVTFLKKPLDFDRLLDLVRTYCG